MLTWFGTKTMSRALTCTRTTSPVGCTWDLPGDLTTGVKPAAAGSTPMPSVTARLSAVRAPTNCALDQIFGGATSSGRSSAEVRRAARPARMPSTSNGRKDASPANPTPTTVTRTQLGTGSRTIGSAALTSTSRNVVPLLNHARAARTAAGPPPSIVGSR